MIKGSAMPPKDFIARLMSQQKNQQYPYSREHIKPPFSYPRVDNPSKFIQVKYGDPDEPIKPFDYAKAQARREERRKDEEDEVARIMMEQDLDVEEAIKAIDESDELRKEVMKPEWWGLKMDDFTDYNGRLLNKDGLSFPPIQWRNPEDKKVYWALRGYNAPLMRRGHTVMHTLIEELEKKQLGREPRYGEVVRTPLGTTKGTSLTYSELTLTPEGDRIYKLFKDNLDGRGNWNREINIQPVADVFKKYGVEPFDYSKSKQYDILYFKEGYAPRGVPGYAGHPNYGYRHIGEDARDNEVRYGDVVLEGINGTKGGAPDRYWDKEPTGYNGRLEPVKPDTAIPARKRRKQVKVSAEERLEIRKALDAEKMKRRAEREQEREEEAQPEEEEEEEEEEEAPPVEEFPEGVKPSYARETEFILWLHQKYPTLSTRAIVKKAFDDYDKFLLSQPTVQRRIKAFKEGKIDEKGKAV